MASDSNVAPVIVRRKKVIAAGGHHGGAWKVAYADFVTAMMAFFMLMWLLNATTEKQRKGIADYFSPVAPISRMSSGSDGMFMGESVFAADTLPKMGVGASSLHETLSETPAGGTDPMGEAAGSEEDQAQETAFKEVQNVLLGLRGESMVDDNWLRHMISRVTDEGLTFEFFDLPDKSLFDETGAPTDLLHSIVRAIETLSVDLSNDVAVEAHVATMPVVKRKDLSWDTSSRHAQTVSDLFIDYGLAKDRIRRITTYGDREPADENLMSVRNNRVEVIFLK